MGKREEIEVVLDFYKGGQEELDDTIEEMKAYAKKYEFDKVSLIEIKESIF